MTTKRKDAKNPVIVHGLSAHLEKWKHDGRLSYVKAMKRAREGLSQFFTHGVSAAAA